MTSMLIGLLTLIFVIFLIGSVSALFLVAISFAENLYLSMPLLVWALPLIGILTGWVYFKHGAAWPGTPQVLRRAHEDDFEIPWLTGPMIFLFTFLSQCFGASTGRESTAVQLGAALGAFNHRATSRWNHSKIFSRELFIRCGLAAGFGAVFGVPWSGALFALEATHGKRWAWKALPAVLISSFGAHWVALAWGAHHTVYQVLPLIPWSGELVFKWVLLGVVFGGMARFFLEGLRLVEHGLLRVRKSWLRPAIGGVIVAILTTLVFREPRYNGLGLPLIQSAFAGTAHSLDFLWKSLFTILSAGSGLKGGEVTPLMAIGATLGAAVAQVAALPVGYVASLGLVSVFASSALIPWTGAVMAWEMFGFEAFLPAFLICFLGRALVQLFRK